VAHEHHPVPNVTTDKSSAEDMPAAAMSRMTNTPIHAHTTASTGSAT
jgi:hypothetical protein